MGARGPDGEPAVGKRGVLHIRRPGAAVQAQRPVADADGPVTRRDVLPRWRPPNPGGVHGSRSCGDAVGGPVRDPPPQQSIAPTELTAPRRSSSQHSIDGFRDFVVIDFTRQRQLPSWTPQSGVRGSTRVDCPCCSSWCRAGSRPGATSCRSTQPWASRHLQRWKTPAAFDSLTSVGSFKRSVTHDGVGLSRHVLA